MPAEEYKYWIRGFQQQMDHLEWAVAQYGRKNPIVELAL
jgi:hypothetical protein